MTELSIVIPYTYGGEQREECLKNLMRVIKAQTFGKYEVIIVEQILGLKETGQCSQRDGVDQYVLLKDSENRPFNKSWCINVGIKRASSSNVLVVDSDTIFGSNYFESIMAFREQSPKFFNGYSYIVLLPGKDNPLIRIKKHSEVHAVGGAWFANRQFFFEELGGMNENYFGYGAEDNDTWERANYLLKGIPEMDYPVVHQYHDWHPENGPNSLNKDRMILLRATQRDIPATIEKLKKCDLGKTTTPCVFKEKKKRTKRINILAFYRYFKYYNKDERLHLDFLRALARHPDINLRIYGPFVEDYCPDLMLTEYSTNITIEEILRLFKADVFLALTKSRMFWDYNPYAKSSSNCWLPLGFSGENAASKAIPRVVLEEDFHYEAGDDWYLEMGINLILQRHYSQSQRKCAVSNLWLPFSVDTSIFKPMDMPRKNRICFVGAKEAEAYIYRRQACELLSNLDWVDIYSKGEKIGQDYVNCLQEYTCHLNGSSRYHITASKMFEIMASGSVLLTDESDDLEMLFPSDSYVSYGRDFSDLESKARRILNKEEYRNSIASKAVKCIQDRHSHQVRVEELLEILEEEFNL